MDVLVNGNGLGWFTPVWRVMLRLGLLALLVYALIHLAPIISTFLLAGAFAYLVSFGVDFLCGYEWAWTSNLRTKRILACFAVYIALACLVWLTAVQTSHPIREGMDALKANWGTYKERLQEQKEQFTVFYEKNLPEDVRDFLNNRVQKILNPPANATVPGPPMIVPIFGWIGYLVELILVPVLAFYFIVDGRAVKRELMHMVPKNRLKFAIKVTHETNIVMRQYTLSQVILCLIAGVVTCGIFLCIPEARKYAVLVGLYAAATRAIPVAGSIIGGIPIVLLAALSVGSVGLGALVAALFTTLHLLESKLVYPIIVGSHMKMHAVLVIAALLIGFEFFGILGMFFAPPIAAIARNVWAFYYLPKRHYRVAGAH